MQDAGSQALGALLEQAHACRAMGSPLYATLLERCAAGADGGLVLQLLATRPPGESLVENAIVMRLLAAVHDIALSGDAPEVAARFPSCGGDGDIEGAWAAFVATSQKHAHRIQRDLDLPLQTNEVGRASALLGGFLFVAERYALPLRVLEIGASAGLMLRWDRFRYQAPSWSWGPPQSSVRLTGHIIGRLPFSPELEVDVRERTGCDTSPIDAGSAAGRRRLLSCIWADQVDRATALAAACDLAQNVPATIERAGVNPWLKQQLARARPGFATVIFHSVVRQYLSFSDREALSNAVTEAGLRATAEAPLAYLTLEPEPPGVPNVVLQLWPERVRLGLAFASLHGRDVRWVLER